ncbi:response regulator transcription factor [Litorivivens sp.]|uniref:response regulator transcription factor n=1 Tax=Litorivivens sp. TaxID=2020868 RepID=UPI003562E32C
MDKSERRRASRAAHRKEGVPLTKTERKIMELIVRGRSIPEVAGELGRHEHTITTHTSNARVKLGAKTVTHAALIFARQQHGEFDPRIGRAKRKLDKRTRQVRALEKRVQELESALAKSIAGNQGESIERYVQRALGNMRLIPAHGFKAQKIEVELKEDQSNER